MKKCVFLLMFLSVLGFLNAQPIELDMYAGTDIWGDALGFIGGLGGRYRFMEDKPLHFTLGCSAFYTYAQDDILQLSELGLLASASRDYTFHRLFAMRAQVGLGAGFFMPKGEVVLSQEPSFLLYPSLSLLCTPSRYVIALSCAPKISMAKEQTNVSVCVTLGFGMRFGGQKSKTNDFVEPISEPVAESSAESLAEPIVDVNE